MNLTLDQVEARLLTAGYKILRRDSSEVAVGSTTVPYWDVSFLNIQGTIYPTYDNHKMTSIVPAMKAIIAGMSDPDNPEHCPFCGCQPTTKGYTTDGGYI